MKLVAYKIDNKLRIKQVDDSYDLQNEFETFDNISEFIKPDILNYKAVEIATAEEINSYNLEQQKQTITAYKEQWKQDGQNYYDEMQNRIIAMLIGVENAVAIMTEIKQTINPMLEQIQRGNQSLAMLDYMDGENNPTIKEVIDLFNEIGQYCITYYQTKYPH